LEVNFFTKPSTSAENISDITCVKYGRIFLSMFSNGVRGGIVVKALRYNPAGRGFDSRWRHWNFSVT